MLEVLDTGDDGDAVGTKPLEEYDSDNTGMLESSEQGVDEQSCLHTCSEVAVVLTAHDEQHCVLRVRNALSA